MKKEIICKCGTCGSMFSKQPSYDYCPICGYVDLDKNFRQPQPQKEVCPECNGEKEWNLKSKLCKTCNGTGKSPQPQKEGKPFSIFNRTYIGLSFMDRIRVLFGKEIRLNIDIEVCKEVTVLKTESKVTIQPFFKPKPNKNDFMQTNI